jgi:hypothetical protein
MRPLPHMRETKRISEKELPVRFSGALAAVLSCVVPPVNQEFTNRTRPEQ